MKILITGVNGQLGHDVLNEAKLRGHSVKGVDLAEMDISDFNAVREVMSDFDMDAVIHCAAYTAVDAAEENVELARAVNAKGTENIAKMAKELDCRMVYISTDYVFNGLGNRPFMPDAERKPLNVYGQTKYEGELAVENYVDKHFIVRISWVFGRNGKNFVKTMLQLGAKNGSVKVVNDQIGSPTYTVDLSRLLLDMVESESYGTYHATNEGECSWYDFAREIFRLTEMNVQVIPVTSEAFPAKAKRPCNSRLSKDKLSEKGFARLPDWHDALERYLKEMDLSEFRREG